MVGEQDFGTSIGDGASIARLKDDVELLNMVVMDLRIKFEDFKSEIRNINKDKKLSDNAIRDLEEIKNKYLTDMEAMHVKSDEVLCKLLKSLGYVEVVKKYNAIEKWCA